MKYWIVYILLCGDDSLYTGITKSLKRRLHEHNYTRKGAKYTRSRRPVFCIWDHIYPTRSAAVRMEATIKKLTRDQKFRFIRQSTK